MKTKLIILFLLSIVNISVTVCQKQYSNRIKNKSFIFNNDLMIFKDSTFHEVHKVGSLSFAYTFGTYKFISKDTIQLKSKYLKDSVSYTVKEEELKNLVGVEFQMINNQPYNFKNSYSENCPNYIFIDFFNKGEFVFGLKRISGINYVALFDSLSFDSFIMRFSDHEEQYYLESKSINKIIVNYEMPCEFDYYFSKEIKMVYKKRNLIEASKKNRYKKIKMKDALKIFYEMHPFPYYNRCY